MTILTPHADIIKYIKTYMNKLYFGKALKIKKLEGQHRAREFLLHQKAHTSAIDVDALSYCFLRLPQDIFDADRVLLTPSMEMVIDDLQYSELQKSSSPARRRECYRTKDLSIMTLQSFSDIHDIVPILTAFQIEYNKMHEKLRQRYFETEADLASLLDLSTQDVERLRTLLHDRDTNCSAGEIQNDAGGRASIALITFASSNLRASGRADLHCEIPVVPR